MFERLARNTEGYAPGSLPTEVEVISTTVPPNVLDSIAATVKNAFAGRPPLLEQGRAWRVIGVTGYVLLIAAVSVLLSLIFATFIRDARATGAGWRATVLAVANTVISSHWINVIVRTAWHHPSVVGLVAASLGLLLWADRRLDAFYSQFWHGLRRKLREAL